MLSGGMDSVAALVWMLENTEDFLHVHHVHLQNRENRATAEQQAIEQILPYLREHYRDFKYTESSWDMNANHTPYDLFVYMFIASMVAQRYRGRHKLRRVVTGSIQMRRNIDLRRKRAWDIFQAGCGWLQSTKGVEWHKPIGHMTKEDVYEYLPEKLRDLTWSCRKPIYTSGEAKPCGKCISCMALKRVRGELTEAQIKAYRRWSE
tara:strand:- start:176 stop:793 length:618 start_codon:yes stop_codon:yes gene_type:complete